jgi:hypothetical protein
MTTVRPVVGTSSTIRTTTITIPTKPCEPITKAIDNLIDDRICKGRNSAERSTVSARQTAMT